MTYKDVIFNLVNKLAENFSEVYYNAEIRTNDAGVKLPSVSSGENWIDLPPSDQTESLYVRRNGDDSVYEDLLIGSCVKSYKMRTPVRIVFFKDYAQNHNKIISDLMQSVLISGVRLERVILDKWRLQKEESSGEYNFGPTTAYFAIDLSVMWHLTPSNCEEDFCIDYENPIKCSIS